MMELNRSNEGICQMISESPADAKLLSADLLFVLSAMELKKAEPQSIFQTCSAVTGTDMLHNLTT